MHQRLAAVLAVLLLALGWHMPAQEARAEAVAASGPVLLTVSGRIANTNRDGAFAFDRAALEALGMTTLTTTTNWTTGRVEFEGVLVRDVLDAVGAQGSELMATAVNDYVVPLPVDEMYRYPVMLALKMNGQYMTMRDKGPIWVVYPRDDFQELNNSLHNKRWVWQLHRIDVQ
jgi:hypothetical protein